MKMETHFHVESARLTLVGGNELLRRSSDEQNSLKKYLFIFNCKVSRA